MRQLGLRPDDLRLGRLDGLLAFRLDTLQRRLGEVAALALGLAAVAVAGLLLPARTSAALAVSPSISTMRGKLSGFRLWA